MISIASFRRHAVAHLSLGLPLIGSQIAQVAVQTTDVVMVGWYDAMALASLVLATGVYIGLFLFLSGFGWAVTPLVAAAAAHGDEQRIRRVTRMGMWCAVLGGILTYSVSWYSEPILLALGQDPMVAAGAQDYLRIAGLGLIPALMVVVLKSYLSALERTRVQFWVTTGAFFLNIAVNGLLIFGLWLFPELGIRGAALASFSVNLLSAIALAVYAKRTFPEHDLFARAWRPDWLALKEVGGMGWQIGLTALAEVGLFNFTLILVGWLGAVELAAHGVVLQLATITFMVQVGLSNAATVRAGQAFGRGDRHALREGAISVWLVGFLIALVSLAVFLLFPSALVGLFVDPDDPLRDPILEVGTRLMLMAALFQIADSLQVMGIAVLRGMQDTRVPMYLAAIAYWGVGVGSAYVLGVVLPFGIMGVWAGIVICLSVAAILLIWRFRVLSRQVSA